MSRRPVPTVAELTERLEREAIRRFGRRKRAEALEDRVLIAEADRAIDQPLAVLHQLDELRDDLPAPSDLRAAARKVLQ